MIKYRKLPVEVEAEQFFFGKEIDGVKVTSPQIIHSLDEKLFYVTHTDAKDWLSKEKVQKEYEEIPKYDSLPFSFWNVKSGRKEFINAENEHLVKLYVDLYKIKYPKPYAWIETIHQGQTVTIENGDWVIKEPESDKLYPCKDEIFKKLYELV